MDKFGICSAEARRRTCFSFKKFEKAESHEGGIIGKISTAAETCEWSLFVVWVIGLHLAEAEGGHDLTP